jgi:putative Mg2+ transporter-C (MgtC) family protein
MDFKEILLIFQSLSLTLIFVGIIGYERQKKNKIAGTTTHMLVALGACGVALLQETLFQNGLDTPGMIAEQQRLIAQVIAGVGFLGTGAILKTNGNVSGLTTASTLWIGAIIGLIFGMGQFILGISVSVMAILVLTIIRRVFGVYHEEKE